MTTAPRATSSSRRWAAGDSGTLTVSWYDRRLDPFSNLAFDRFLTYSTDGGATWNPNVRISDVSSPVAQTLPNFDPNIAFCYHGDYDQVAVVGDVVHVLWADDRRITGTGPNPDVYYDQFSINTSLGRLTVGQSSVGCSGTVAVSLSDSDLAGNGSQAVAITGSSGDAETLSLAEISGTPGRFTGSMATAAAPVVAGDGVLQVQDGDTLTITYNDADDGHGQTVVTTAQVRVDCAPPVISNVTSTLIARDAVTIASQASEPVNMRVDYGTSCATLTQSKTSDGFSDSPSLSIFALAPGRTFRFAVTATDASGNSTRDDNGGVCYAFSTPDVLFQTDFEKDQAGFTFDNTSGNGNGLWHRGGACAALVLGHSPTHTLYYGRDDTCTYDQAGVSNSGIATSPVINLASETFASRGVQLLPRRRRRRLLRSGGGAGQRQRRAVPDRAEQLRPTGRRRSGRACPRGRRARRPPEPGQQHRPVAARQHRSVVAAARRGFGDPAVPVHLQHVRLRLQPLRGVLRRRRHRHRRRRDEVVHVRQRL